MRKALTVAGLIAAGAVLGAGLVQLGRSLERDAALPPAAAAVALPSQPADVEAAPSDRTAAEPTLAERPAAIQPAGANDDPPALVARAEAGYAGAKRAVLEQPEHKLDELLLLGYVVASDRDRRLLDHLAAARKKVESHPSYRLLAPSAKAPLLRRSNERGLLRLHNYLLAAIGEPDELALELLAELAARTETGYALCHQVLALGWYESTGRRLTDELQTRRSALLAQIEREQEADSVASDLFAERASTLLLYGAPARAETRRWVEVLLAAQQDDGTWGLQPRTLTFDGESLPVTPDTMHTVAHATFVLRRFVDTSAKR